MTLEVLREMTPSTLQAILENLPGYVVLADLDYRIAYCNRVGYGFTLKDVVGADLMSFSGADQKHKIRAALDEVQATGVDQSYEHYLDTPAAGRQWFINRVAGMRTDGDELAGYIIITTEVTVQKRAEMQLKKAQADLIDASHRAGMAEVATGVLHNIGNVLNSVNVSATTIVEQVSSSHVDMLARAIKMLEEQGASLGEFLAHDAKGRKLPALLSRLADHLMGERDALTSESKRLVEHIGIIRAILEAQQSIARTGKVYEEILPGELLERALAMFRVDLGSKRIELVVEAPEPRPIYIDKQGALQILVNLIRNALEALADIEGPRKLHITAYASGDLMHFDVVDNGCGISPENLTKLFRHGFTTKRNGHGFGLHASALAARAMGGALSVRSDGPGKGARFSLSLPRHASPRQH